MTQSIICSACGSAVPYGRLSCPECGELLASVAGARRAPEVLHDAGPATGAADSARTTDPEPVADRGAVRWSADASGFEALLAETAAPLPPPTAPPPPGAYVPPSPVAPPPVLATAPASAAVATPAAIPAPARAWAGHGAPGSASASDGADGAATAAPGGKADSMLAEERAGEFVGWLAIAGAALALVGMVLPWSSLTVIGAAGVGYFDRWGIAGPGHLLFVAAIVGVLALALLRERVPAWLGLGLPGLALGGLLLGLTWPYLVGPLGGHLGAWAVALGAVLLMAAGAAAIVVDRHARGARVV